jgi:hypothetical protein
MTPKNHKMWRMSQREDKVLKKEGKTRKIVQDIKDQTISILEVFNPRGFVKYELTDEIISFNYLQKFITDEDRYEIENNMKNIIEINFPDNPLGISLRQKHYFNQADTKWLEKRSIEFVGHISMLKESDLFILGASISFIEEINEVLEIFELKLGMEKDHLLSYDLLSS